MPHRLVTTEKDLREIEVVETCMLILLSIPLILFVVDVAYLSYSPRAFIPVIDNMKIWLAVIFTSLGLGLMYSVMYRNILRKNIKKINSRSDDVFYLEEHSYHD